MQTTTSLYTVRRVACAALIFIGLSAAAISRAEPLLNGVAIHEELGKEQFIAGLYTSTLSSSPNEILISREDKQIQVRVLAKRFSSRRFKRMWIEGMAINASPTELEKHAKNMATFTNMLKLKLTSGDIFAVNRSSEVVTVTLNGSTLGELDDPQFFDLLLRTWIGPVPLSSEFRSALLARGEIAPAPLARFEGTRPSDERIATVEAALAQLRQPNQVAAAPKKVTPGPKPVVTAPKPKIEQPIAKEPKVAVSAPTLAIPEPEVKKEEPKPEPVKEVALAPQEEILDESIFDDDDVEFTAESLLVEQLYISRLKRHSHKFLRYPERAWERNKEGNVRVSVTINRSGKVQEVTMLEEADYSPLNKEAVKATKRASPFPAMPDDVNGEDFSFTIPIVFKIVDKPKK